ncbi:MAG: hypothetical protein OXR73_13605 [Myxococcales bacterium]|nr:hypothetical protein [Myxococcales bacterium]
MTSVSGFVGASQAGRGAPSRFVTWQFARSCPLLAKHYVEVKEVEGMRRHCWSGSWFGVKTGVIHVGLCAASCLAACQDEQTPEGNAQAASAAPAVASQTTQGGGQPPGAMVPAGTAGGSNGQAPQAQAQASQAPGQPVAGQPGTAPPATGSTAQGHALMGRPGYPPVPYPAENPDDDAKAMLGKVLFWEEQLSGDGTVACGTCHMGSAGGSDPRSSQDLARLPGSDGMLDPAPAGGSDDRRGSPGIVACDATGMRTGDSVQVTGRKAPSALDAMFFGSLFWDGRAGQEFSDPETGEILITGAPHAESGGVAGGALESQAVGPFMSPVEMSCGDPNWQRLSENLTIAVPLALAKEVPADMRAFVEDNGGAYPQLFAKVFGSSLKIDESDPDEVINARRIAYAVATYERRLTSDQTPWDRWNAGDATALTEQQVRGYEVFMGAGRCGSCHAPPLFTDFAFHYLGFHPTSRDPGQGGLEGAPTEQQGRMKTPTLRNVGLREAGGLLHQGDGPGGDMMSVLELYRAGGLREDPLIAEHIDPLLMPFEMSDEDLTAMAEFLRHGLTDQRAQQEAAPFDRPKLSSEP